MIFFHAAANLPDNEKARIEYLLYRIVDFVGVEKVQQPVIEMSTWNSFRQQVPSEVLALIGRQLDFDFAGLQLDTELQQLPQAGGGG